MTKQRRPLTPDPPAPAAFGQPHQILLRRHFDHAIIGAGLLAAAALLFFEFVPNYRVSHTPFEAVANPIVAAILLLNVIFWLWRGRRRPVRTWRITFAILAFYLVGAYASELAAGGEDAVLSNALLMWFPAVATFGSVVIPFALLRYLAWSIYGGFVLVALAWLVFGQDGSTLAWLAIEMKISAFLSLAALLMLIGEIARNLEGAAREANLAREAAEQASRAKSDFLARMSHDLRTPLNVVIGYSEVIADEVLGGPEAWPRYRDYAHDIRQSGEFLLAIVNDILDITRIETGTITLRPAPVDIGNIIAETLSRLSLIAARDGVSLLVSAADGVGTILADQRAVEQIIQNLVSNAVKFTPAGGRAGVRVAREGDVVTIEVWDEGIGIAEAEIPRLGEPFRRISRPGVASKPGTGLGIAIVKNLIGLHGGTLAFTSALGQGTTARVTLPARPPAIG